MKRTRLRLDPASYKRLCREVMERDGWGCQICGSRQNLHVHHNQFRSRQGRDEESNLTTVCARCHDELHDVGFSRTRLARLDPTIEGDAIE
jgi:5-methylcytosine-specific restriction endonuclease McrA